MADDLVYSSYVEAYLSGAKAPSAGYPGSYASTETYGYGPAGSQHRLRKSKNHVEGSPLPAKPHSVLWRPQKAPSAKNAENLDVQHERDKAAFERRANSYRRLAQNGYHHNAPPGSILTTFEQGHIVDRGRGKSDVHESRGIYDPVNHCYRIPPAPAVPSHERPSSAPHTRGYAAIYAAQQGLAEQPQPLTAAKQLQTARGIYNPLTHEYKDLPQQEYAERKEREFQRVHGLGQGLRRLQPFEPCDPITWKEPEVAASPPPPSPAPAPAPCAAPDTEPQSSTPASTSRPAQAAARGQRPSSAPGAGRGHTVRKKAAGESWGTYNPLTHEWKAPPANPKFLQQEALVERQLGVSGQSAGRTATPQAQGVYNPILNTWTVPPADPRVIDGLSFKPATLFSRPTPATIRM